LLAHGAGAGQDHARITGLRDRLAEQGLTVLTFNYPYIEAGRRRPDPTPVLLSCHRAAAAALRERVGDRLILSGRSMGGRMGTLLAAQGEPCAGLVLFAYPLHPAGRPERLRIEHLAAIHRPMLFVQGSRDALARADLVDRHLRPLAAVTVIEGADHSFRTAGVRPEEMDRRLATIAFAWITSLNPGPP
jgi:hypothetical protein